MSGLVRTSAKAFTGAARAVTKSGKKLSRATVPSELDAGNADRLDSAAKSLDKKAGQIHFSPRSSPQKEAVIPLPDEEALDLARRRRRSRRQGARASTVLSGGDAETVG